MSCGPSRFLPYFFGIFFLHRMDLSHTQLPPFIHIRDVRYGYGKNMCTYIVYVHLFWNTQYSHWTFVIYTYLYTRWYETYICFEFTDMIFYVLQTYFRFNRTYYTFFCFSWQKKCFCVISIYHIHSYQPGIYISKRTYVLLMWLLVMV